ncbi:hybrid sensor histidine kinase/response regulator [Lichenicoccus roseus]|uniref:PAS domain S-box protein n=1 Tax=Lichenicoccus roseus TaxID=2683649 RepID=A0A5R9JB28_9PROT|nr:PAS domain S-box protein [Lichenicoccus roseus]TLU71438.1 PAS domain S-box protein [Lichenicoccus roseus]
MAGSLNISEAHGSIEPFHGFVPAVYELNVCMVDADGMITSWKTNIASAGSHVPSGFVGQHHSHLFTPEDRTRRRPEQVLKLAVLHGGFAEEGWRVRRDGSRYWASVVVEPVHDDARRVLGFTTMMRDISETRALREALRRSEQHIDLIMSSITDYAIFVLDTDGIVASWNPAAEEILGYGKRDIVGQHFSCFFSADDRESGKDALVVSSARAAGQFEDEGWRIRRDGSRFWARVVVDAIRDEHGDCIGFAHVTRDITLQRTIDELEQKLAHSQSGVADGIASGEVAHQFNDLLSAVAVSLDLITRSDDISTMHRLTRMAQRAAQSGARLTATLLETSQADQPQVSAGSVGGVAPALADDRQVTVLVVDDDPDVLELASCAVQELGYVVVSAADAEAAVAILENDPSVGLLFTDIIMSKSVSGLGLARRARELNPALRILLTSGYPRARLQSLPEIGDGMAFISKPYELSTLDAKLRELTAIRDKSEHTQTPVYS